MAHSGPGDAPVAPVTHPRTSASVVLVFWSLAAAAAGDSKAAGGLVVCPGAVSQTG